jgi:hypothetical protein
MLRFVDSSLSTIDTLQQARPCALLVRQLSRCTVRVKTDNRMETSVQFE